MLIAVNLYFYPPCFGGGKENSADQLFNIFFILLFNFCLCEMDLHFTNFCDFVE